MGLNVFNRNIYLQISDADLRWAALGLCPRPRRNISQINRL